MLKARVLPCRAQVRNASVGQWRQAYSESDKKVFKAYAGPTLLRLGYAQNDKW